MVALYWRVGAGSGTSGKSTRRARGTGVYKPRPRSNAPTALYLSSSSRAGVGQGCEHLWSSTLRFCTLGEKTWVLGRK